MSDTDEHPTTIALVAFRLSALENGMSGMNLKLDQFIEKYPSKEVLDLILKPYRDDINDLTRRLAEEDKRRVESRQQYKFITVAAVVSPLASIIVSAVVAAVLIGLSG